MHLFCQQHLIIQAFEDTQFPTQPFTLWVRDDFYDAVYNDEDDIYIYSDEDEELNSWTPPSEETDSPSCKNVETDSSSDEEEKSFTKELCNKNTGEKLSIVFIPYLPGSWFRISKC